MILKTDSIKNISYNNLFYYPACKFLAIELQHRFEKLGQTSAVIETGYQLDGKKKRVQYTKSELYYIESLEGVCDALLEYNIHKERKDSNRFSRGKSMTFQTLDKLVDRGVKVDLGIPHELWDSPSAEITALKQQCEGNLEQYENIIEQWYWGDRKQPLDQYLCRERVLPKEQLACLDDPPLPPEPEEEKEATTEKHVETQQHKEEL